MKYRTLGKTGIEVSEIGFGTWAIGGGWGTRDDKQALAALERALDFGVTLYDTAKVYGHGHSERLVGQAFKDRRDRVVIASKIPPKTMEWPVLPNQPLHATFPASWIVECTEESLRNLKTDYLDLQQLHAWTPAYTELDEWYEAFISLRDQGKIRAFGVSANDWDPYGAVSLVEAERTDAVQVVFNLFEQRPVEQLLPAAEEYKVGILARVPFEEGLLTGSLRPGHVFAEDDWRAEWLTPERLEEASTRVDALKVFLGPDCPDLATLALKYCLSHSAVTSVIPGMRTVAHVEANVAASDGVLLSDEALSDLRAHAFSHGWDYPWSMADLVTVGSFPDHIPADLAKARLAAAGIDAILRPIDGAFGELFPGVASFAHIDLQVPSADAEEALEVLAEPPIEDAEIPDDSVR